MTVVLVGASGTVGRAVAQTLADRGHDVICPVRRPDALRGLGVRAVGCDITRPGALTTALGDLRVDGMISCLASRTGYPADAWAIDHAAQKTVLEAVKSAGARHFVLLSAICVQKPRLAFQFAKLAFERELQDSGIGWTIVRPTAFFKSLSGQVARVKAGQPYMVFGNGRQTACKPISNADLASYLAACLDNPERIGRILPIGGPGPAITPLEQGERLFEMVGRSPRIRHVPASMLKGAGKVLSLAGHLSQRCADKAEFARIGHYYATESMLAWDPVAGRYDADATPETGQDTLWDHYEALLSGRRQADLGAHAMF